MIEKILENLCFQGFFAVSPVTTIAKGRKVKKKDITLSNALGVFAPVWRYKIPVFNDRFKCIRKPFYRYILVLLSKSILSEVAILVITGTHTELPICL